MKKYIISLSLLFLATITFAKDGAEHKIINIVGAGRVEVNIGEQFDVKPQDVFQVFGRGQIIHPATGSLVERDNVYLGRIKIIEVKALSSIAETIERRGDFSVGNRIIKVASEEQEIVEHKRPVQAEFERPRDRSYSETIYTQKSDKDEINKLISILKIMDDDNGLIAILNKGRVNGVVPNSSYSVYVHLIETSSITGLAKVTGKKLIGNAKVTSTEYDGSYARLLLSDSHKIDLDYLIKNNFLRYSSQLEYEISISAGLTDLRSGVGIPFNVNLGIDWYPVFENENHNDYFWIGGNFKYSSIPFNFYEWYNNVEERLNTLSPGVEIGFSPARKINRNKAFYFGYRYFPSLFKKNYSGSVMNIYDGNNYDHRLDYNIDVSISNNQLFFGYQFNQSFFIETSLMLNKEKIHKDNVFYLRLQDDYWPYEWAIADKFVDVNPYSKGKDIQYSLSLNFGFGFKF